MRKLLLTSVAMAALAIATTTAQSQSGRQNAEEKASPAGPSTGATTKGVETKDTDKKSSTKSSTDTKTKADTKSSADTKTKADTKSSADTKADTKSSTDTKSDSKMGADADKKSTTTGQAKDSKETTGRGDVNVNISQEQKTKITQTLISKAQPVRNVNFSVSVGTTIPQSASIRYYDVPQDIVVIVPQFRGYQYFVVEEEIVIVEPRSRRIVYVMDRGGSPRAGTTGQASSRITLSAEERQIVKSWIKEERFKPVDFRVSIGAPLPKTVEFQTFPATIVEKVPSLRSYRFVVTGEDNVAIVEPGERNVVTVID